MIKLLKLNIFTVQPLEGGHYQHHHLGKNYRGDSYGLVTVENRTDNAFLFFPEIRGHFEKQITFEVSRT